MSDLENQNQNNEQPQDQPLFNEKQLEYINSLLNKTKEEANKAVNAIDKRYKTEVGTLQSTIEELKLRSKLREDEQQTKKQLTEPSTVNTDSGLPNQEPNQPTHPNSVAAVRKEMDEKIAAQLKAFEEYKAAQEAEKQAEREKAAAAEKKATMSQVGEHLYKALSAAGFEDIEDALVALHAKYPRDSFTIEDGEIIYVNGEEKLTSNLLVDAFKSSNLGKRFIAAIPAPSGSGLPSKSTTTISTTEQSNPQQELENMFKAVGSGKAQVGYRNQR